MDLSNCHIGFGITGSFCTFAVIRKEIKRLVDLGAKVTPVFSYETQRLDTRFGSAKEFVEGICLMTESEGIRTIPEAEPIGPNPFLDVMVIAPCTGNTLAKLACGITDTAVCMVAKAHLRGDRPVVIALASNDAMSANFKNIATLYSRKNMFFVPMIQDDPEKKPHSLVSDFSLIPQTLEGALKGIQIRKMIL